MKSPTRGLTIEEEPRTVRVETNSAQMALTATRCQSPAMSSFLEIKPTGEIVAVVITDVGSSHPTRRIVERGAAMGGDRNTKGLRKPIRVLFRLYVYIRGELL